MHGINCMPALTWRDERSVIDDKNEKRALAGEQGARRHELPGRRAAAAVLY